jgi:N-acetylglucosaminyl-diphospho-decaprenol L-rhamnosyltransferase
MSSSAELTVTDVVIVSFRSAGHLDSCLDSVLSQGESVGRIVVVDSGSDDNSVAVARRRLAERPGDEVIALGRNVGFATAANRGVAQCTSTVVLVLNPDAVLGSGSLRQLDAAVRADPTIAAVTGDVRNPDGTSYPSGRRFPSIGVAAVHGFLGLVMPGNPWSRRYLAPQTPDWVSGTAMALSRAAFEAVGGFDEGYFMYVEDVDICWRWRRRGFRVGVVPGAVITHEVGGSSRTRRPQMALAHHRSLWRFAQRSTTGWQRLMLPIVFVGLAVRAGLVMAVTVSGGVTPAARHAQQGALNSPDREH